MARVSTPTSVRANTSPVELPASSAGRKCANCGKEASASSSVGSSFCGGCLLSWAFEPGSPLPVATDFDPDSCAERTQTLGEYVLEQEIGRGGMGVIYRAVHRETGAVVALKTVLPHYEDCSDTLARFRREAETAQRFDHPHSMPILEVGSSERGVPFFTMPLAVGGSLFHLTDKYHRRWTQIARLLVKVAEAVHHAHSHGVLHRDIKPGNILFTEDHEPLVTDFGLAKPMTGSDNLTKSYSVLGTPNYVAPEQAAGKTRELTAATDIYSLGAVLFELLTGRPPFIGDNPLHVLEQVSKGSPPHPRRLVPAVPRALDQICMRCLKHDPADRYASAQELADDLERWLDGRKIARRPRYIEAWNFIRKCAGVRVWCGGILGLVVLTAGVWLIVGRSRSPAKQTAMVGLAIENFEQDPDFERVADQAVGELKNALSITPFFRLQGNREDRAHPASEGFDPLAYGRAINAQAVFVGSIRRVDGQVRLVTRLLRCDTGAVIWRHADQVALDQTSTTLPSLAGRIVVDSQKEWLAQTDSKTPAAQTASHADAQTLYTRGAEIAARKTRQDLEAAVVLFKKASEADPKFAPPRAMLSFTLWSLAYSFGEQDQRKAAITAARETLAIDENSAQAHRVIALCFLEDALYPEALAEFWRAAELNPQSAGCWQSLGICLRRMGRPGKAILWFERAIKLDPVHGDLVGCLGEAYFLCGHDDLAEPAFLRAIELDGDAPNALVDLGTLRTWQGRFDEARQYSEQIDRRFPDNRWVQTLAAWVEFCAGTSEAEKDYEQLRASGAYQRDWIFYGALNPSSALAYLAKRAGKAEAARSLAEEAMGIDLELLAANPRNPRALHDLAATRCITGDVDGALDDLQRAVEAGWIERRSTQIDPRFADCLMLPRYKQLLDDMTHRAEE